MSSSDVAGCTVVSCLPAGYGSAGAFAEACAATMSQPAEVAAHVRVSARITVY